MAANANNIHQQQEHQCVRTVFAPRAQNSSAAATLSQVLNIWTQLRKKRKIEEKVRTKNCQLWCKVSQWSDREQNGRLNILVAREKNLLDSTIDSYAIRNFHLNPSVFLINIF